ncbi:MAG: PQQ-binding-like beta-propeller repeat protein [Pseudomonadota bacterium]
MGKVSQYNLLKTRVLNLGRACLETLPVRNESEQVSQLKLRLDSLERERYRVTVIGEVSAGKSSFVNALMRHDLLPWDVRLCTSAIVEIFHGNTPCHRVVFADGNVQELSGEDGSLGSAGPVDSLARFAGIQDRFREIPTGLIDAFVVAGKPVPSVAQLEEMSGFHLADKKSTIEDYIQNWALPARIPVEVHVTYPFIDGMRPLTIVDTPGVNAVGGIQDKTWAYLACSDAVIVMCSIRRHELTPFQDLVRNCVHNFSAENIYVILTHTAVCSKSDRERLLAEAKHLLNEIPPDRIVAVDSILRSVAHEAALHGLAEVMKDERKVGAIAHLVTSGINEETTFLDLLRKESNFDAIESQLTDLGRRVPIMLVDSVLESVAQVLRDFRADPAGQDLVMQLADALDMRNDYKLFGEGLVCFGGKDGVFAVDKNSGELKWRYETPATVTSELFFTDGLVVFGCYDGSLQAVDIRTGQEKWKLQTSEKVWSPLGAAEGVVCFGGEDKILCALDALTGLVLWQKDAKSSRVSPPLIADGTVYFGTSWEGTVFALDLKTGEERWTFSKGDWRQTSPKILDHRNIIGPPDSRCVR